MIKRIFIILIFILLATACDKDKVVKNSCITTDDCKNEEICFDKICQIVKAQCQSNDDCSDGGYCNEYNRCIKTICPNDDYCGRYKICKEEQCIDGCRINTDCSNGEVCIENRCQEALDCRDDQSICTNGFKCNIANGKCEINNDCSTNSDCPDDYKCDFLKCTPKKLCSKDSECGDGEFCTNAGYCDIDTGNCDSNQYCIDRFHQGRPICNTLTGVCNECMTNNHCPGDVQCKANHKCDMPICDRVTCDENSYCDPSNGECLCVQGFKNVDGTCVDMCSAITCDYDNQSCIVNEEGEAECIKTCYQDIFSVPAPNYDRAHAVPITPGEYGTYYKHSCSYDYRDGYCSNRQKECDNGKCKYKSACPDTPCSDTESCVDGYCYTLCSSENPGQYGYCTDGKICNRLGECVNDPICDIDSDCATGEMCLYTGGKDRCEIAPLSLIALNCDYAEDWYSIDLITGETLKVEIHYNSTGIHDKTIEIHSVYNGFLVRSPNNIDRVDAKIEYTAEDSITHFIKIYNSFRNNEVAGYSMRVVVE